jgi:hypothetical protein
MNRLMLCLLVAVLGAPVAAWAQAVEPEAPPPEVAATAEAAANPDEETSSFAEEKAKPVDHFCLRHTGSLIRSTGKHRCTAIGRSYSQDDLRRTGEIDLADALRRLDSSIY